MRRIERGLLLVLVVLAVLDHAIPARAGGEARAVAATEFTLVSDNGTILGSFRIGEDGTPALMLANGKGQARIALSVKGEDDTVIGITDAKGNVRVGLYGQGDGQHSVVLADKSGPRLALAASSEGRAQLTVMSSTQKELVVVGRDEHNSPRFSITSEAGDARLRYSTDTAGTVGLYLLDKNPAPRAGLEIDGTSSARVFVQDAAGKGRAEILAPFDLLPSVVLKDRSGKRAPVK